MNLSLGEMIKEAVKLPLVPLAETSIFQENMPILKKYVDDEMASNPSINVLIGNNPLQVMYDNHNHHSAFMTTVFSIGNYDLLVRTMIWAYRSYAAHNFSYDYFPIELKTWIKALEKFTPPDVTINIISIYDWMIKKHENMVYLSKTEPDLQLQIGSDWLEKKSSFLSALIEGDHRKSLNIAKESVLSGKDIEPFYLNIIQPSMYEVGMLWERGTISVAQEHLASAIVTRVMAASSMMTVAPQLKKTKIVITAAPNEFHEIGAWILSDILEHSGWDVKYLGANTPTKDLIELLHSFQPDVLALTVTMPFNILKATEIINLIKSDGELEKTLTMIGGHAFNESDELWKSTGADCFAANAGEAKTLLNEWEQNGQV
jgi:methanogenic corrinoid protein MtbC1